jgi:phage shock protein A
MAGEVTVDAVHRIAELREVDVDALLGRAEDTSELLDYTAAQQQELLGRIWTAITDVAASRKRARMRESRLRRSADRLQRQAGQAAAAGRAEYARQAMAWRTTILHHVAELAAEQEALRVSEERLFATAGRLQSNIEAFRIHREMISHEYTAARAATSPGQLLRGLSAEPRLGGTALVKNQIQAQLDVISRRTAVETAMAQIKERRHAP